MKRKAYAKVNIALDVVGKREDGYHLLKMIMQTVDLYDVVEVKKNNIKNIRLSSNKHYIPTDERNLAYKAAKLFREKFDINEGVDIHIEKNIPVAAGMAGGSTDAATVLYLMNKVFDVKAKNSELEEVALKIGADVPYCIHGGTALCEGIGEELTALKRFKNKVIIIVKPNFGVSTKDVYKDLDIRKIRRHVDVNGLIKAMQREDINYVAKNMKNVLENVTLRKHNVLRRIKEQLIEAGALGAMMSGSGPTIFAFFEDMLVAQRAFEKIKSEYNYSDIFITRTI
ncbi:MAG: 4-(cytidine 5'-diphospho)-2-C-methyl-D-erythritol kinase [Sarcina sp.]